jgi:glutamyl-tRNA synthetase
VAREQAGRRSSWRLACPDPARVFCFSDQVLGAQCFSHSICGGDFALRRSDGVWAYQLAVSVDDALMGVTQVVRGEDILMSTPRQLLLFELMGVVPPSYTHIPLLHDAQGDRLAKRHQSLSLQALREAGRSPGALVGWLAALAGFVPERTSLSPYDLLEILQRGHTSFPWHLLPPGPVIVPHCLS